MEKENIEIIYVASRIEECKLLQPRNFLKILFLDKTNLNFYEKENLISAEFLQDLTSGNQSIVDYNIDDKIQEWIRKSDDKPVSLEHIYKNYSPEMLRNALPYLRDLKLKDITNE